MKHFRTSSATVTLSLSGDKAAGIKVRYCGRCRFGCCHCIPAPGNIIETGNGILLSRLKRKGENYQITMIYVPGVFPCTGEIA